MHLTPIRRPVINGVGNGARCDGLAPSCSRVSSMSDFLRRNRRIHIRRIALDPDPASGATSTGQRAAMAAAS
jgi:hypothetical protein